MNYDATAVQCCEKLSQQMMKNIFKETSERTVEQRQLQLKTETTRLKANGLLKAPSDLALNLLESERNAEACRVACREIEALRQSNRENWRCEAADSTDQNTVLKDLGLERTKLIHLEIELEKIRNERKDRSAPRTNRVPVLITQFGTTLNTLKSSADKLDMMKRRRELALHDVTVNTSQHKYMLAALQDKSQNRQMQERTISERCRTMSTAHFVKEHMRCSETAETQSEQEENYQDTDKEILKERLISERETNKQLEGLCVCTRHWLLQEENFQKAVEMLETTNQED